MRRVRKTLRDASIVRRRSGARYRGASYVVCALANSATPRAGAQGSGHDGQRAIEALSLRMAPRAIEGLGALSNRLPARQSNMLRYSLPSSLTEGGIPKQKVPHTFNRDPASAGFLFLTPVALSFRL
jgi:hypothetical protein